MNSITKSSKDKDCIIFFSREGKAIKAGTITRSSYTGTFGKETISTVNPSTYLPPLKSGLYIPANLVPEEARSKKFSKLSDVLDTITEGKGSTSDFLEIALINGNDGSYYELEKTTY